MPSMLSTLSSMPYKAKGSPNQTHQTTVRIMHIAHSLTWQVQYCYGAMFNVSITSLPACLLSLVSDQLSQPRYSPLARHKADDVQ